ncbi:MAG: fluoride efflux transporter CrcB [Peptococcaceae bacterium]|nr:fluoride efflux transporter CrcB [Peptococcaceae bacterium]
MTYLFIAVGGMLGALARFGLGTWIGQRWNNAYPLGTFLINITGAFVLGFINVYFLERTVVSPALRLGIGVGFLGAYTTFSTFTYEAMRLIEDGSYMLALGYVSASAVIGLIAVYLGMTLGRNL